MLVVKVELHNANTGEVSEIARAVICNVGGTNELGDYLVAIGAGGETDLRRVWHDAKQLGRVERHPRLTEPVWSLVRNALEAVGF